MAHHNPFEPIRAEVVRDNSPRLETEVLYEYGQQIWVFPYLTGSVREELARDYKYRALVGEVVDVAVVPLKLRPSVGHYQWVTVLLADGTRRRFSGFAVIPRDKDQTWVDAARIRRWAMEAEEAARKQADRDLAKRNPPPRRR